MLVVGWLLRFVGIRCVGCVLVCVGWFFGLFC